MKLISQGDKSYLSEDGQIFVNYQDDFETECDVDSPHPMRMTIQEFNAHADHYQRHLRALGARQKGKYMVWQCPGGEVHTYGQWVSSINEEWTEFVTDKFSHQIGELEALLGEKITVSHPRKPKVIDPREAELRDELEGIRQNLKRWDELMASEDAIYADRQIHVFNLRRKAEIEAEIETITRSA